MDEIKKILLENNRLIECINRLNEENQRLSDFIDKLENSLQTEACQCNSYKIPISPAITK